jgi:two-component system NtrC family sensor kinase
MVQHLGRTKDRNLIFEPKEAVIARVNPQELKQVLLNLVVNALESTDEGGTVRLTAEQRDGEIKVAVTDDGCGMTPEVMHNLFEPFYTRNRTGKGTGLGLSISHLIISQHAGTLDATSDGPGKGSTFTIRLPQRAPAMARAA